MFVHKLMVLISDFFGLCTKSRIFWRAILAQLVFCFVLSFASYGMEESLVGSFDVTAPGKVPLRMPVHYSLGPQVIMVRGETSFNDQLRDEFLRCASQLPQSYSEGTLRADSNANPSSYRSKMHRCADGASNMIMRAWRALDSDESQQMVGIHWYDYLLLSPDREPYDMVLLCYGVSIVSIDATTLALQAAVFTLSREQTTMLRVRERNPVRAVLAVLKRFCRGISAQEIDALVRDFIISFYEKDSGSILGLSHQLPVLRHFIKSVYDTIHKKAGRCGAEIAPPMVR